MRVESFSTYYIENRYCCNIRRFNTLKLSNSTSKMIRKLCQSTVVRLSLRQHRATPVSTCTPAIQQKQQQQTRSYLGDAGEMQPRQIDDDVAKREQELWNKAQPKYDAIMERHLRLPTVDNDTDMEKKETRELDIRKKRLIYRSKQRGWLEVDLLLGTWASEHVSSLSVSQLDEFEAFVNLETIDIYNVLTLRVDVPEDMKSTNGEMTLVEKIQNWAKESPLGKASREKYVEVKTKNNLI